MPPGPRGSQPCAARASPLWLHGHRRWLTRTGGYQLDPLPGYRFRPAFNCRGSASPRSTKGDTIGKLPARFGVSERPFGPYLSPSGICPRSRGTGNLSRRNWRPMARSWKTTWAVNAQTADNGFPAPNQALLRGKADSTKFRHSLWSLKPIQYHLHLDHHAEWRDFVPRNIESPRPTSRCPSLKLRVARRRKLLPNAARLCIATTRGWSS